MNEYHEKPRRSFNSAWIFASLAAVIAVVAIAFVKYWNENVRELPATSSVQVPGEFDRIGVIANVETYGPTETYTELANEAIQQLATTGNILLDLAAQVRAGDPDAVRQALEAGMRDGDRDAMDVIGLPRKPD